MSDKFRHNTSEIVSTWCKQEIDSFVAQTQSLHYQTSKMELEAVNFLCKMNHLRYVKGFWIHLCHRQLYIQSQWWNRFMRCMFSKLKKQRHYQDCIMSIRVPAPPLHFRSDLGKIFLGSLSNLNLDRYPFNFNFFQSPLPTLFTSSP